MRALKRKQYKKWTWKEEEALAAGVAKYGIGNWKTILQDSKFAPCFTSKSCDDLVNKWRNLRSRVSDEKLRTMSPKVKKIVTAHLDSKQNESAFSEREERGITGSSWTVEEEEALAAGVVKYGMSKWMHIREDPEFGPILAIHSCRSLVNKWRNLTDRVSEEKLRRMSYKVRKVVDAYLRNKINDDDPAEAVEEEAERISGMEEDTEEISTSCEVRNVVDDNPAEAAKELNDVHNSDDPAQAVKEKERVSKVAEDIESMLVLLKEICGRCMAEDTNRVSAASPPEAVKETARVSETAEDTKSMLVLLKQMYERFM
ncbi:hypothetical protein M0R45_004698 [Rubus argutus]|uniref:MYB transcription factor n=1 Tax=Rubus argutus TaxID=59490 RepID=A0AAW1YKX7_RUBAR